MVLLSTLINSVCILASSASASAKPKISKPIPLCSAFEWLLMLAVLIGLCVIMVSEKISLIDRLHGVFSK